MPLVTCHFAPQSVAATRRSPRRKLEIVYADDWTDHLGREHLQQLVLQSAPDESKIFSQNPRARHCSEKTRTSVSGCRLTLRSQRVGRKLIAGTRHLDVTCTDVIKPEKTSKYSPRLTRVTSLASDTRDRSDRRHQNSRDIFFFF